MLRAFTYDDAGRLRTVTVAGSPKATYTYDGLERLAIRTLTNQTPSGTTHFIHMLGGGGAFDELAPGLGEQFGGLGNRIIGETDGAGNLVREYVWLDDLIIAVVSDANTASPQIWWVTNDHLGRPVQMTDWSKTVVWRASHRPFGEVTAVTGTASLDARFPGQWFQLESGLSYNWHRHYDASIGRYTQPDPLGVKAGPSVYGYAGGNPVMGVDPEGRFWWVIPPLAAFGAAMLTPDPANAPAPGDPEYSSDPLEPYKNGAELGFSLATGGWAANGKEFMVGACRIAPFGNRTGNKFGRWPHYHRSVPDPTKPGTSMPGQGIKRHRPWEPKSPDQSFWDRF